MNKLLCLLALYVLSIGYVPAARVEDGSMDDNSAGDIYIDDTRQTGWEVAEDGSADYSSGWDGIRTIDDEDTLESSGGGIMTDCQTIAETMRGQNLLGAYIPRCTQTGEYEAMQCSGSTGDCWCVNNKGQTIPGTQNKTPWKPDCDGVDREREYPEPPIKVDKQPGLGTGNTDNTDEIEEEIDEGKPGTKTGGDVDISPVDTEPTEDPRYRDEDVPEKLERQGLLGQPLILAGLIAIAVVCLLCAVLLVMFIVYRMRKKDEGSYALDEPKRSPSHPYQRAPTREYFA